MRRIHDAVARRVAAVSEQGDHEAVLGLRAFHEARRLAKSLRAGAGDVRSWLLLGWFHWYRHRASSGPDAEAELDDAVAVFLPFLLAGDQEDVRVGDFPPQLMPVLIQQAVPTVLRIAEHVESGAEPDLSPRLVAVWRRILDASPDHPERAAMLSNLGISLFHRYEWGGDAADLDEAVRLGREAVAAGPHDRAGALRNLATALRAKLDPGSAPDVLDEMITVTREYTDLAASDGRRASFLGSLSYALHVRFMRLGRPADLDEAVRRSREALAAVDDNQDRALFLSGLAHLLYVRFDNTGVPADLAEAVALSREAVEHRQPGGPYEAFHAHTLGMTLQVRYSQTGRLPDLDEAIDQLGRARAATADGDSDLPLYSCNLGNALRLRFDATGAMADLDEAVRWCRESVDVTTADDPRFVYFAATLGGALKLRSDRTDSPADLDRAIAVLREARDAVVVDHLDGAMIGSNLAGALQARFALAGDRADVDEAIDLLRRAVETTSADNPRLGVYCTGLGNAVMTRFELDGDPADLDEAVAAGRRAIAVTAVEQPDRAAMLTNLARALRARFTRTGDPADHDEAVRHLEQALDLEPAPATRRLDAARLAGELTLATRPHDAAVFLERAVRLLPEIAPRHLDRDDQQHALGRTAGLVSDAAALVLADPAIPEGERAVRALQLLESGRSVLLGQALELRGDLTDLHAAHPRLAERFVQLRDILDADPAPSTTAPPGGGNSSAARRRMADELSGLLREIRRLDGFRSFGLPPAPADLLDQAANGPVVTFNVSRHRADAILLTDKGITAVPLPESTHDTVVARVSAFYRALRTTTHGATATARVLAQRELAGILAWLWDAAAGPALDALGYRSSPGHPAPRVWWATGGLLGLLPVHAAGHHADGGDRTVLDRVVPSYTPTITALRHARRRTRPASPAGALIVGMPTTPGLPGRLDFVPAELRALEAHLPGSTVLVEPDGDTTGTAAPPTRDRVLAHLATAPVAHFACHGVSDADNPSLSRLLLHDHATAPLTVATLSRVRLDHARLAYLSACETAASRNADLVDESIHLATAFQLAGFPHVVGTLWTVDDEAAARVAETFYAAITTDGVLDADRSAHGLRQAVLALRAEVRGAPALWASHLHIGP